MLVKAMEERKKEGVKNQKEFSKQYRSETGHALASFATYRILSEKLRFSCFSQVPTGSDYPAFRPILPKISFFILILYTLIFYEIL